jgi:hypothetical protein
MKDCLNEGCFKNFTDFHEMNLPLTIATWVGLRAAVLLARKKFPPAMPPLTLDKFLKSIKKGSKKFREVIDHK